MAFPRIEALTFWLLMAGGVIFVSTIFFGGFPTGWTGYAPLNDEANFGFDSYIFFFALVGLSMTLLGLNLIATIATMRAPGLTWSRLPIFCWGVLTTSGLMVLAAPVLIATLLMVAFDRALQTSFFLASAGGSPYLFENLFWFFGHPEVYVLALPGFGIILELLPVFSRKPLWGYRLAVAGMLGVALPQLLRLAAPPVRQRDQLGAAPVLHALHGGDLDPTGFIFLCGMATLWRAKIRYTVPMLFCLAWFFNFFIGGVSGFFLSDTPSDVSTHGTFFVMAHFHYTIMGGLIFAFFAGIYYWVPKMTGLRFNERLAKIHFWSMFIAFNSTFGPLFALGLMGQPRRVATYASNLQGLNIWVSVSAFVLGASMLVFLANVLYSMVIAREPAEPNPWHSKSMEWQVPTPVPVHNFDRIPVFDADPYDYGIPPVRPTPRRRAHPESRRTRRGSERDGREPGRGARRAAGGSGAQPVARGSSHGRGDDHVLPRLRVRLLLPALAEQRRSLARAKVDPQQGYGAVIVGLFVAQRRLVRLRGSGGAKRSALAARRRGGAGARPRRLRGPGVRVREPRVSPHQGGYASVFLGWTLLFTVFALVALYWVEIVFATGLRHRATEAYVPHGLDAASFYWTLLVVLGVIAWVILYLL